MDALSSTSVLERLNLVGGCGCRNSQCWYTSLCFLSQSSISRIPRGASITSWSWFSVSVILSSAPLRKMNNKRHKKTHYVFQKLENCLVMAVEAQQLLTLMSLIERSYKLYSLRSKRFRGVGEQRESEEWDFGVFPARKMVRETKRGKRGRERGRGGRNCLLPHPPLSFFAPAKHRKSRSSGFLCSQTHGNACYAGYKLYDILSDYVKVNFKLLRPRQVPFTVRWGSNLKTRQMLFVHTMLKELKTQ